MKTAPFKPTLPVASLNRVPAAFAECVVLVINGQRRPALPLPYAFLVLADYFIWKLPVQAEDADTGDLLMSIGADGKPSGDTPFAIEFQNWLKLLLNCYDKYKPVWAAAAPAFAPGVAVGAIAEPVEASTTEEVSTGKKADKADVEAAVRTLEHKRDAADAEEPVAPSPPAAPREAGQRRRGRR